MISFPVLSLLPCILLKKINITFSHWATINSLGPGQMSIFQTQFSDMNIRMKSFAFSLTSLSLAWVMIWVLSSLCLSQGIPKSMMAYDPRPQWVNQAMNYIFLSIWTIIIVVFHSVINFTTKFLTMFAAFQITTLDSELSFQLLF